MPKIKETFIKENPRFSRVILQLLYNRGIKEAEKMEEFLNPDYEKYNYDPFIFKYMSAACDLIIKHIKQGNKIVVYGDYDADGVTASAVLAETLALLKAKVEVYIPDRISEGYGLNKSAIDEVAKNGVKLIVTVDNGIRNKEEIKYAKNLGLDIIITDHHEAPEEKDDLPDCLLINPMIDKYPTKDLAGVGVAFKVASALIRKSNLKEEIKQKIEEKSLDLVAIGTVADLVNLTGENRILVKKGLDILNQKKRLGLALLIKQAQINGERKICSWNISWQIAPRLNSAGRLEHANTAYELLITKDKEEAEVIARRLNDKNVDRQKMTDEITESCRKIVNKELINDKILILISPNLAGGDKSSGWSEGVVGLVAGRLCEEYSRPALVITQSKGEIKGSGRSIEEFNIGRAVEDSKEFLLKFGGHAQACGFSLLDKESLSGFMKKMKKIAGEQLKDVSLKVKILVDAELDIKELDEDLVNDLEKFEPFGEGNARPIFLSRNLDIRDIINMGANGQHIKFRVNAPLNVANGNLTGRGYWALGFGQAEKWKDLRIGDKVDMVYYVEFNEFNGRREIQMKVIDIKRT